MHGGRGRASSLPASWPPGLSLASAQKAPPTQDASAAKAPVPRPGLLEMVLQEQRAWRRPRQLGLSCALHRSRATQIHFPGEDKCQPALPWGTSQIRSRLGRCDSKPGVKAPHPDHGKLCCWAQSLGQWEPPLCGKEAQGLSHRSRGRLEERETEPRAAPSLTANRGTVTPAPRHPHTQERLPLLSSALRHTPSSPALHGPIRTDCSVHGQPAQHLRLAKRTADQRPGTPRLGP